MCEDMRDGESVGGSLAMSRVGAVTRPIEDEVGGRGARRLGATARWGWEQVVRTGADGDLSTKSRARLARSGPSSARRSSGRARRRVGMAGPLASRGRTGMQTLGGRSTAIGKR